MHGAFSLWEDLKNYAASYARTDRPLPLDRAAHVWLQRHMWLEFPGQRFPVEAYEFYIRELVAMVEARREALSV